MIDQRHLMILSAMREAARLPLTTISKMTGIPNSSVFDLHQRMLNKELISHVSHLDYRACGYPHRKRFQFTLKKEEDVERLRKHPWVNTLTRTETGELHAETLFPDLNAVEAFKENLQQMKATRVKEYDVLDELKHETFLPR
jgi:DNA-binding Lrp family transcriptional regulator